MRTALASLMMSAPIRAAAVPALIAACPALAALAPPKSWNSGAATRTSGLT